MTNPFILIIYIGIGMVIGYFLKQTLANIQNKKLQQELEEKLTISKKEAENIVKEAREKSINIIEEAKKEKEKILDDVLQREQRISQREKILDNREITLIEKEKNITKTLEELKSKNQELNDKEKILMEQLQKISGFSQEEALKMLFEKLESDNEAELISRIIKLKQRNEEEIAQETKKIIYTALPRYARSVVNEITTTTISLPNEEMKGRIIGKEGRNIKHFENLTGVEIVIDETPDIVILSSFDPVRREIARLALEKLLKDGRIHPASIEEKVQEAKEEIEKIIEETGKNASYELGIFDLPQEIMILMGRLKFRYSYGQNVLQHSIEMAHIAKMIAEELNLNPFIAKKGAFLHDIGKAVTHEIEGSHLEIGIKILQKYNIEEEVILAMRSHHETYPFGNPYAYIVLAADIFSAGRPGARRETTEIYLQRVNDLEKIANSFEGVEKSFAISGGRELRVFVSTEKIKDIEIYKLAKDIAQKIEKDLRYPGEIKVVVIRENRAVEYAR